MECDRISEALLHASGDALSSVLCLGGHVVMLKYFLVYLCFLIIFAVHGS